MIAKSVLICFGPRMMFLPSSPKSPNAVGTTKAVGSKYAFNRLFTEPPLIADDHRSSGRQIGPGCLERGILAIDGEGNAGLQRHDSRNAPGVQQLFPDPESPW